MKPVHAKVLRWISVLIYLEMLWLLSTRPVPESIGPLLSYDKLAHAIAYGLLAALMIRAQATATGPLTRGRLFLCVLFAAGYGAMIEMEQGTIPYRSASLADGIANTAGAAAVVLLWGPVTRRFPCLKRI